MGRGCEQALWGPWGGQDKTPTLEGGARWPCEAAEVGEAARAVGLAALLLDGSTWATENSASKSGKVCQNRSLRGHEYKSWSLMESVLCRGGGAVGGGGLRDPPVGSAQAPRWCLLKWRKLLAFPSFVGSAALCFSWLLGSLSRKVQHVL